MRRISRWLADSAPPRRLDLSEGCVCKLEIIKLDERVDIAGFASANCLGDTFDAVIGRESFPELVGAVKAMQESCFQDADGSDESQSGSR